MKNELPSTVKLVAVSKFNPVESIQQAYEAGQRIFGESRPQELQQKVSQLPDDIKWHFIGHLQTNKLKMAAAAAAAAAAVHRYQKGLEQSGRITQVTVKQYFST